MASELLPIQLDMVTTNSLYANYARVLLEKKLGSELPLSIEMLDEDELG